MTIKEPYILYEDADIIALDKPSGIIVYPDGKHDYPALDAWLEQKYGVGNFHFVHRLDRETSGVLLVARTQEAHAFLKEQFAEREVRKVYRAFVHGVIQDERGVIDKPIGNARGGMGPRSTKQAHGQMREALTTFRVIARTTLATEGDRASYVEVFPKTGRTHQIRVHFSSIQHPVLSDRLYAPGRPKLLGFERLALHALSITITHPSGEEMTFTAPLPPEFVTAEAQLRSQ
ncbi:MAG: RluA family pseudouridine synthase [Candidatus Adlerbacteria bacterium]|nr:RluA family pseudouridine synthase [Candidatus Adlerbacteria bacterium]